MTRTRFRACSLVSRPMARTWLLLLLLLALVPAVLAAPPAARRLPPRRSSVDPVALDKQIIAEAKNGSEIMANLTYLSDMIGPRLTGSAALKKANEWTAEKMRAYGLSNVHLEGWTIPVGWERGTASVQHRRAEQRPFADGRRHGLDAGHQGQNHRRRGRDQGAQRRGAGLGKYKGKLKNAVDPAAASQPRSLPSPQVGLSFGQRRRPKPRDEKGGKQRDRERQEDKAAAKPSAAAAARARLPAMMAFRRELMEFLRTEGAAVLLHGLRQAARSAQHDRRLAQRRSRQRRRAAADPVRRPRALRPAVSPGHPPGPGPDARRSRDRQQVHPRTRCPSTTPSARSPAPRSRTSSSSSGAHLDSWDLGQGTTDNGTGSCVVLEAARILAKSGIRPKRTIRFVLFTGEEQGLHGSQGVRQEAQGRDGENVDGAGSRHRHRQSHRHRLAGPRSDQADHGEGAGFAEGTGRDGDRPAQHGRHGPPVVRGSRRAGLRGAAGSGRVSLHAPLAVRHAGQGRKSRI